MSVFIINCPSFYLVIYATLVADLKLHWHWYSSRRVIATAFKVGLMGEMHTNQLTRSDVSRLVVWVVGRHFRLYMKLNIFKMRLTRRLTFWYLLAWMHTKDGTELIQMYKHFKHDCHPSHNVGRWICIVQQHRANARPIIHTYTVYPVSSFSH